MLCVGGAEPCGEPAPEGGPFAGCAAEGAIDACEAAVCSDGVPDVADIIDALEQDGDAQTLKILHANSPLSMAAGLAMVRAARNDGRMQDSLAREYRFTHRATQETDFLEGVRAQIIDKDRNPAWGAAADAAKVDAMLANLGEAELTWED